VGAKSQSVSGDTLDKPHMIDGLQRRALPSEPWAIVREKFLVRAEVGLQVKTSVYRHVLELAPGQNAASRFCQG